jgi:2-oxoglutarate dehydrogenase E2 component (dihydrolipoamide succinyltransferase)
MAIVEVKVPQLSESVAEATLLQWKKKAGEAVAIDEILIEIETDKVVLEVPAPAAGVLVEIVQADGASPESTPKARPVPQRPGRQQPSLPPPVHRQQPTPPAAARRPGWPCRRLPN